MECGRDLLVDRVWMQGTQARMCGRKALPQAASEASSGAMHGGGGKVGRE